MVKNMFNQVKQERSDVCGVKRSSQPKVSVYLYTCKFHKMSHTTKKELDDDLADIAKQVKKAEWSSIIAYETDSIHRMHLHTVLYITGRPPIFKSLQIPGRQRYFKKISNAYNGYIYISKQRQDEWSVSQRFDNNESYWEKIQQHDIARKTVGIKISDLLE